MELQLYEVDTDYTAFLHGIDDHVRLEHIGAKQRKFVGVVMEISGIKYYAPMGSPKPKYAHIKASAPDIYKISDGTLGVININNMIPVVDGCVKPVDINAIGDEKYKTLLGKQIRQIKKDEEAIAKKASKLYMLVQKEFTKQSLKDRCCDFKLLEQHCKDYKPQ